MRRLRDFHAELNSEERERLWTNRRHHDLVLWHIAFLPNGNNGRSVSYRSRRQQLICRAWGRSGTLLRARTRFTSSRLCWEIFKFSSSDRQPSHDRQALSSSWEPSFPWEEENTEELTHALVLTEQLKYCTISVHTVWCGTLRKQISFVNGLFDVLWKQIPNVLNMTEQSF